MKINSLLALGFLLLLSCSEFTNQDNKNGTPTTKAPTAEAIGENPFPVGFDPNAGEFTESKMIANIGLNVIAPTVNLMRIQSEVLALKVESLDLRLRDGKSFQNELLSAQSAWRDVMLSFHFLEGAPVGPMSDRALALKENIYSWPYFNPCGVDTEVVVRSENPNVPVSNLPGAFTLRGLLALEYLLFEKDMSTACPIRNPMHAKVLEWTKKSSTAKFSDRMKYATLLAKELLVRVESLEKVWSPRLQNYTKTMIDGSHPTYPQVKDATTALSDALFSVEVLKDRRLGIPLGIHKECTETEKKCPLESEHRWSGMAFEAMDAQVDGFEAVFFGKLKVNGFGFDDFLKTLGRQDVVDHFQSLLSTLHESNRVLQGGANFEEQVVALDTAQCKATTVQNRMVPVCAYFQDVRQLSLKMKSEFLTALSLRAPPTHQGDSD